MLRVLADNHYFAFSLNDFALIANLLYGWFNLHFIIPTLSLLLCTPCDASLGQVVYRNLNGYAITRQYSDIVHSKLTGNMSRYDMPIGKLHFEGRIGQCLDYRTFKLNNIILRQNNPSSAYCLLANCVFVTECLFLSNYHVGSTKVVITTPSEVRATVFS